MKIKNLTLPVIFSLMLFGSQVAVGSEGHSGNAIHEMAQIMMHLNHYPSDAEKKKLKKMMNDDSISDAERDLAQALINLEHSASSSDKPKLKAIMDDASAPQNARDMASIIYNLNHKPSSSDKAKLKNM